MKILIVEDEVLVAMDLTAQVEALGAQVLGPAHSLRDALDLVDVEDVDLALLDVNLRGQPSFPVARRLQERHVPFLFLTGYDSPGMGEGFDHVRVLPKPIEGQMLSKAIRATLSSAA